MDEPHDPMRARLWLGLVLGALLLSGLPLGVAVHQAGLETVDEAPGFTLTSTGYENGTLGEPVEFSLSDYRNKTVLLDFMAIACTSCRLVERQVLEPIYAELRDHPDFVLLSIDTWADPETGQAAFGGETNARLAEFQEEHGHDWRHALDEDKVFRKYDAVSLPKLAVVGPEGQLVDEWRGQPSRADVRFAIDKSMAGEAEAATVFRLDNIVSGFSLFMAVAFVAGVAAFFAPCSVGLIPAYMGFLLQGAQEQEAARRAVLTLRAGLVTGAGIVSIYGVIALALWGLSLAGFGGWVSENIETLRPIMAGLLIVLGILMLFQVSWDWLAKRMGMGSLDGRKGFYTFGVGYGLAAFGCTGPLFLPVLVLAFAAGALTGFATFAVYSLAIAAFVLLAAGMVATGHRSGLQAILSKTNVITKVSAILLAGAGVWLLWFDWQAGVLF